MFWTGPSRWLKWCWFLYDSRNNNVAVQVTLEDTKRATVLLIRKLFLLMQNLDALPNNVYLTMKLYYYDDSECVRAQLSCTVWDTLWNATACFPHQSHPRWLPTAGLQGGRMWQPLVWRSGRALQGGRSADGLPRPESACVGWTRTTEKASGREPPEGDPAGSSDRFPTGGEHHGGDRQFCLLSKRHLFYGLRIILSDYTNVLHKLCYRNRVGKCTKRIFPLKMVCPCDNAVRKLECSKRLTMLFL